MRKSNKVKQLGKTASHRKAMIKTQLSMLFEKGRVETTTAKAKVLKSKAEQLIQRITNWQKSENGKDVFINKRLNTDEAIDKFNSYLNEYEPKVRNVRTRFRKGDRAELSEVYLENYDKLLKNRKE